MDRASIATRADELLELFELSDRAKDQVEPLSGGMKRRLSIARSLIASPRILMLMSQRPVLILRRDTYCGTRCSD